MAAALLVIGACLVIGGTAVIYWPAALIVGGCILVIAGVDLTRRPPVEVDV